MQPGGAGHDSGGGAGTAGRTRKTPAAWFIR